MPCLNFSSQPVDALNSRSTVTVFNCVEKCFAFSWRSRPEISVPVDLCWINRHTGLYPTAHHRPASGIFLLILCLSRCCQQILRSRLCFFPYVRDLLLMPNSWAKFVPFSPLSKREHGEIIICLSLIDRRARFRFVDMFLIWVYDRSLVSLHDPPGRN